MVTVFDIIVLAIIQGITEWLPISSSGHLVIFQELRGIQVPVGFDVGLHLGSVVALGLYFRRIILVRIQQKHLWFSSQNEKRLLFYLAFSGVSTGIVVFILNDFIRLAFSDLRAVGIGLLITALFLSISKGKKGEHDLSVKPAILIGLAQGVAAIPGISRSGLTFSVGILSGIRRELVFIYSLLLSVPTIIGAMIIENRGIPSTIFGFEVVILGFVITTFVGYSAIALLKTIYDKKSGLFVFVPYCLILGVLLVVFSQQLS